MWTTLQIDITPTLVVVLTRDSPAFPESNKNSRNCRWAIFDIRQEGEILSIEVPDVAKKFRKPAVERFFEKYVASTPRTMV